MNCFTTWQASCNRVVGDVGPWGMGQILRPSSSYKTPSTSLMLSRRRNGTRRGRQNDD